MNSIARASWAAVLCRKSTLPLITAVRNHGWNKDFVPGPYPKTLAERKAAADKYGIPLSEYEPYPDDGEGSGDYPNVKLVAGEARDPFYPWDCPELKRNFEETLHRDFDAYTEDKFDPNKRFHQPMWMLWTQFFVVVGGMAAVYLFSLKTGWFVGVSAPEIPGKGKVHYTFEPCD